MCLLTLSALHYCRVGYYKLMGFGLHFSPHLPSLTPLSWGEQQEGPFQVLVTDRFLTS